MSQRLCDSGKADNIIAGDCRLASISGLYFKYYKICKDLIRSLRITQKHAYRTSVQTVSNGHTVNSALPFP